MTERYFDGAVPPYPVTASLDRLAAECGDRTAFWWEDHPETFAEFRQHVRAAGAGLRRLGLGRGDRFAVYLENCAEFAWTWVAGLYTGVQPVTINLAYKDTFLAHQLADSEARIVVTSQSLLPSVLQVLAKCPSLRAVVVLGGDTRLAQVRASRPLIRFEEFCTGDLSEAGSMVSMIDPAAIVYTSGTTGPSKGVVLSQGHLAMIARSNCEQVGISAEDVTHIPVPLFHMTGLNGLLHAMWSGCSTVVERKFRVETVLARMRDRGVTVLTVVGPILQMLWSSPPSAVERELRLRAFFGNPVLVPFEQLAARFGVRYVATAYGQTEVQPCLTGRLPEIPFGSCGRLHPNLDARLMDDDGRDVGENEPGELVIKARVPYAMFDGYINVPRSAVFPDGWYHTGDVLRRDHDGFYYWLDRKKDVLRRRGENISSVEIEKLLVEHPAVAEVAIHAVPSELGEDEVKAVVVLAGGARATPGELSEFWSDRLPRFALPRYIDVVDELPRNPTGRVLKWKLRELGLTASTWDRLAQP